MRSKAFFQVVWLIGLLLGVVVELFYGIRGETAYQQPLFWGGLGHMAILVLLAFGVEVKFKGGSGTYVQYAGYIWTLIGVVSILLAFTNKEPDINLLRGFLYGAGLAVGTSIIGWTVGKLLEDRAQIQSIDAAAAASDDLARTLLRIRDGLENAGKLLSGAMSESVENIRKMNAECKTATAILEDLSKGLKKSGASIIDTLDTAKSKFSEVVPEIESFQVTMTTGLAKIKKGVDELAGLADHTKGVVTSLNTLATTIETSANTTQKVVDQSILVIEHSGRFIDQVFKSRNDRR